MPKIQGRASEVVALPEYYDESQDIRAGILINIHEDYVGTDMKNEIRDRLLEINNVNKLVELSQMGLKALQVALGIRPPVKPVSQEPISVPEPPPTSINTSTTPPDTLDTTPPTNDVPFSTPPIPTTNSEPDFEVPEKPTIKPPPDKLPSEIIARRRAEVEKYVEDIEKILQKAKIHPNDYLPAIEVLKRTHPNRLGRIVQLLKTAKKKERVKILCDWFVVSQKIEEIEMLVTHWQGIQQGAGAFQAAIGMSRFDNILEDMSNKDIEDFITRANKAVYDVQESQDINIRLVGVEEIKELASDLFRKYVTM